jgi:hypothetical protein
MIERSTLSREVSFLFDLQFFNKIIKNGSNASHTAVNIVFFYRYAKDYIVLFNKIRPSLPDCAWKILRSASAIHEEYMFKWMIEEMINYGTEPLKPKVTQIGKFDFKYPDDAYRISLLISNPHPYFDSLIAKLHKILLSTAKETYYQTTDTRIKASALAALQIYSMRSEQQIAENLA